jgi:hypothetical protein
LYVQCINNPFSTKHDRWGKNQTADTIPFLLLNTLDFGHYILNDNDQGMLVYSEGVCTKKF